MRPTYEELLRFLEDLQGHNSYWWQEAPDMSAELDELLSRVTAE